MIRHTGIWRHQSSPGPGGLEHQVRRCPAWVRRVTLAMPTHAFLAVVRADEHAHRPTLDDVIPFACHEICRLFIALVVRPPATRPTHLPRPTGAAAHQA
ncbi:hypothetical protein [Streptomyces sp. NPDC056296]|uniref:hypothetical protein n=1 Tax=Streptomyces sp. NPDC056296 TaxID=3345775 RepID=UPI0035D6FFDD